jgi:hypothetical protein
LHIYSERDVKAEISAESAVYIGKEGVLLFIARRHITTVSGDSHVIRLGIYGMGRRGMTSKEGEREKVIYIQELTLAVQTSTAIYSSYITIIVDLIYYIV